VDSTSNLVSYIVGGGCPFSGGRPTEGGAASATCAAGGLHVNADGSKLFFRANGAAEIWVVVDTNPSTPVSLLAHDTACTAGEWRSRSLIRLLCIEWLRFAQQARNPFPRLLASRMQVTSSSKTYKVATLPSIANYFTVDPCGDIWVGDNGGEWCLRQEL
jgi:hypothetical protein